MAAATHAHYIRTIHTSFTAAHPHSAASSAWASAAVSSQYLNHYNQHQRPQNASISTHNTHMYTHHLRDLTHSHSHSHSHSRHGQVQPPQMQGQGQTVPMMMTQQGQYIPNPAPAPRKGESTFSAGPTPMSTPMPTATRSAPSPPPPSLSVSSPIANEPVAHRTRRRSLSIRMPPTTAYKFDPFADEPITPVLALPLPSAGEVHEAEMEMETAPKRHEAPYTIHIPAAQQMDIQLYTTPPPTPRLAAATLPPRLPSPPTQTSATPSRPLSPRAPTFTPRRTPSPPAPAPPAPALARAPPPNLSKVVANIMLNRVHAGGRQRGVGAMRRRVMGGHEGEGYVKSCLSRVVSVEA